MLELKLIPRTRCVHAQNDESQSMCTCVCVCGVQEGLTALMLATQKGHAEVVQALLNANADPNITENVSIEREMVATLFIDNFCFSTDCWMDCVAFCCKVWQFEHH